MTERLHIAQFNDGYPPVLDGVVTCVRNYARWLNEKYGACTLIVPGKHGQRYDEPYRVIPYRSLPLAGRPPYRVGMPALDLGYHKALRQLRCDLVHTHSPFIAGAQAVHHAKKQRIPCVATFHSKYYDDFLQYTKSPALARQGVQYVIRRFNQCDAVWACSEGTAETLRTYGYRGPITIMPNGTDLVMPDDAPLVRARAQTLLPFEEGVPMFLFVGQHIWQKNLQLIVDACERLLKQGEQFHMVFVGNGAARDTLLELVEQKGLSHAIHFLGPVRDRELLTALYLRAQLFVFPSVYDNAPLVIREAAAMHTPSVVVAGSNAAQDIHHLRNGLLCDETVDSLCEQLRFALCAPDTLAALGQAAGRTLARSWESIVDDVYQAYVDVLARYRHAAHGQ